MRIEADEAATLGGQQRLLDVSTFNTWIEARAAGPQDRIADLYVERFSPDFRVAFDAWLLTRPFSNPDAPPGPSFMPDTTTGRSNMPPKLNEQASAMFETGTDAPRDRDRYVRLTVLLATVLFLVAISQRFTFRAVRLTATSLAFGLMVLALIGVITLPRL